MSGVGETAPCPYSRRANRFRNAGFRFRSFQDDAPELIKQALGQNIRGAALEREHSFYVNSTEQTIEARFGRNLIPFRQTENGKLLSETGVSLVYSFGPTGHVMVSLWPGNSDAHRMEERWLRLDLAPMSGKRLRKRLSSHVRDMVAYQHATAIDGDPTLREKVRVSWLRHTHQMEIDGKVTIKGSALLAKALSTIGVASLGAILKPLAILTVLGLATWLGWGRLVAILTGSLNLSASP